MLVDPLSPEDSVRTVVYAGAAGTVLEPTKVKEKGKILAALDRLQAGGSTGGGAGINLAESASGRDSFGYRTEFLNLVRLAKSVRGM